MKKERESGNSAADQSDELDVSGLRHEIVRFLFLFGDANTTHTYLRGIHT